MVSPCCRVLRGGHGGQTASAVSGSALSFDVPPGCYTYSAPYRKNCNFNGGVLRFDSQLLRSISTMINGGSNLYKSVPPKNFPMSVAPRQKGDPGRVRLADEFRAWTEVPLTRITQQLNMDKHHDRQPHTRAKTRHHRASVLSGRRRFVSPERELHRHQKGSIFAEAERPSGHRKCSEEPPRNVSPGLRF